MVETVLLSPRPLVPVHQMTDIYLLMHVQGQIAEIQIGRLWILEVLEPGAEAFLGEGDLVAVMNEPRDTRSRIFFSNKACKTETFTRICLGIHDRFTSRDLTKAFANLDQRCIGCVWR